MIDRGALVLLAAFGALSLGASAIASRERVLADRAEASERDARVALEARARAFAIGLRARSIDGAAARVDAWSRAIAIDATFALPYVERAEARVDQAQSSSAEGVAADGDARAALFAAIADADEAVARGAGARAFYVKGRALDALDERDRAREAYFEAARVANADDPFVRHAALAALALHDGRYRDAIDESSRALDAEASAPDMIECHARASQALRSGG